MAKPQTPAAPAAPAPVVEPTPAAPTPQASDLPNGFKLATESAKAGTAGKGAGVREFAIEVAQAESLAAVRSHLGEKADGALLSAFNLISKQRATQGSKGGVRKALEGATFVDSTDEAGVVTQVLSDASAKAIGDAIAKLQKACRSFIFGVAAERTRKAKSTTGASVKQDKALKDWAVASVMSGVPATLDTMRAKAIELGIDPDLYFAPKPAA